MSDQPSSPSDKGSRERTKPLLLIITKLQEQPEYLLMIAVGLLGGGIGLGTTAVGLIRADNTLTILGFVSWALLLIVSFLVIRFVKKETRTAGPASLSLGGKAQEAFMSGGDAEKLQGRWQVQWFQGEGPRRRSAGPDFQEQVDLLAYKSKVSCVSYDVSTKYTYWLEGRLCDRNNLALIYWSGADKRVSGLTGVVFLKVDDSFENYGRRMKGCWRGLTRDNQVMAGEVEWTKMG
jgi:hypothetical protein